jgi:hypothetical protein
VQTLPFAQREMFSMKSQKSSNLSMNGATMDSSQSVSSYPKEKSSVWSTSSNEYDCYNAMSDAENMKDDDTELLSSFASMMLSSIETLQESSLSSSMQKSILNETTSKHGEPVTKDLLHKLQKNEIDCFGYLQFQVSVCFIHEVPTELSVVSGKLILYMQTKWCSCTSDSHVEAFVHPLLIEAIETLFIPVAIIPNHCTNIDDQKSYHLRISSIGFMDATHQDLVAPISLQELSFLPILLTAILYVLNKNEQQVPIYLIDLAESCCSDAEHTITPPVYERRAWFGFHDTVPTESEFNALNGVTRAQIGNFLQRDEYPVVEVTYNYKETCFGSLVQRILTSGTSKQLVVYCQSNDERMAARVEISKVSKLDTYHRQIAVVQICESIIFEPAMDNRCFGAIRQTPLRYAPMTEYQTTKGNHFVTNGQFEKATQLLSPRQTDFVLAAMANGCTDFYDVVGYPILDAWLTAVDKTPPRRRSSDTNQIMELWKHDTGLELYSI